MNPDAITSACYPFYPLWVMAGILLLFEVVAVGVLIWHICRDHNRLKTLKIKPKKR